MTAGGGTFVVLSEQGLQMPQWWSGNGVSELLTPVRRVVPVLGAGVGRDAGLPDARQLAEWLADNVPLAGTPTDCPGLFQVVDALDPFEVSADELQRKVAAYIESFPLRPTPFLDELVRLPSRFIITLSYDDLVGFVAEQQGLTVREDVLFVVEVRDGGPGMTFRRS